MHQKETGHPMEQKQSVAKNTNITIPQIYLKIILFLL